MKKSNNNLIPSTVITYVYHTSNGQYSTEKLVNAQIEMTTEHVNKP